MNAADLETALLNLFETLADASDELEGEDDDIALADYLRDIVADFEGTIRARSYEQDQMLTRDKGLTIRCAGGAEFQLTIVQTKRGTQADDSDDER